MRLADIDAQLSLHDSVIQDMRYRWQDKTLVLVVESCACALAGHAVDEAEMMTITLAFSGVTSCRVEPASSSVVGTEILAATVSMTSGAEDVGETLTLALKGRPDEDVTMMAVSAKDVVLEQIAQGHA